MVKPPGSNPASRSIFIAAAMYCVCVSTGCRGSHWFSVCGPDKSLWLATSQTCQCVITSGVMVNRGAKRVLTIAIH